MRPEQIAAVERLFIDLCMKGNDPVERAVRLRSALRKRAREISDLCGVPLSPREWNELSMRVLIAVEERMEPADAPPPPPVVVRADRLAHVIVAPLLIAAAGIACAVWLDLLEWAAY